MANPKLFGTDGVRGTAGQPPLDPPTVRRLGAALVRAASAKASASQGQNGTGFSILVGRDTRESGEWIDSRVEFGDGLGNVVHAA